MSLQDRINERLGESEDIPLPIEPIPDEIGGLQGRINLRLQETQFVEPDVIGGGLQEKIDNRLKINAEQAEIDSQTTEIGQGFLSKLKGVATVAHDIVFPTAKHIKRMYQIGRELKTATPEESVKLKTELDKEAELGKKENLKRGILGFDVMLPFPGKSIIVKSFASGLYNLVFQSSYRKVGEDRDTTTKEALVDFGLGMLIPPVFLGAVKLGGKLPRVPSSKFPFKKMPEGAVEFEREMARRAKSDVIPIEQFIGRKALKETEKKLAKEEAVKAIRESIDEGIEKEALKASGITEKELQEGINIDETVLSAITSRAAIVKSIASLAENPLLEKLIKDGTFDKRLFQEVGTLIRNGQLMIDDILPFLDDIGMPLNKFAKFVEDEVSAYGRGLGEWSQLMRRLNAKVKGTPAEGAFKKLAEKAETHGAWHYPLSIYKTQANARKAFLTSMLSTANRNVATQAFRGIVEAFDTTLQGTIQAVRGKGNFKNAFIESMDQLRILGRRLTKEQSDEMLQILKAFPLVNTKVWSTPVHEIFLDANVGKVGNNILKGIQWVNRTQEMYSRKVAFQMRLVRSLRRMGHDPFKMDYTKVNQKDLWRAVNDAGEFALEGTFARPPGRGSNTEKILNVWNNVPLLDAVNPFPRFLFANALPFLYEFSPAGLLRLIGAKEANKIGSASVEAISRAMIGTGILAGAYALRLSKFAGDKPYEIRIEADAMNDIIDRLIPGTYRPLPDGKAWDIDTRPYSPFLFPYMLMGELFANPDNVSVKDFALMFLGLNRLGGTSLVFFDWLKKGTPEGAYKQAKEVVGQYYGGFTVPFRQIKDVSGLLFKGERIARNTRLSPMIAPLLNNIPYFGAKYLPPLESPFEPEPRQAPFPFAGTLKQLTGVALQEVKPLEELASRHQLDYRSVFASTGIEEADAKLNKIAGLLAAHEMPFEYWLQEAERISPELLSKLPKPIRKAIIKAYFSELKSTAKLEMANPKSIFYDAGLIFKIQIKGRLTPEEKDLFNLRIK